jgi:hypothetical protein
MRKFNKIALAALAIGTVYSTGAFAQVNVNTNVGVLAPLDVSVKNELRFGRVSAPTSGTGTVIIDFAAAGTGIDALPGATAFAGNATAATAPANQGRRSGTGTGLTLAGQAVVATPQACTVNAASSVCSAGVIAVSGSNSTSISITVPAVLTSLVATNLTGTYGAGAGALGTGTAPTVLAANWGVKASDGVTPTPAASALAGALPTFTGTLSATGKMLVGLTGTLTVDTSTRGGWQAAVPVSIIYN